MLNIFRYNVRVHGDLQLGMQLKTGDYWPFPIL